MLCLGRRVNQSIEIGPNVTVRVLAIGPDKVRLGITAPDDLAILRTEIIGTGRDRPKPSRDQGATNADH
jgi:carbon storage regulator